MSVIEMSFLKNPKVQKNLVMTKISQKSKQVQPTVENMNRIKIDDLPTPVCAMYSLKCKLLLDGNDSQ